MKRVNILDCTLRDGAYLVNKEFGKSSINGIIDGLMRTGIDFVEIGFLQNEGAGEGKTVYYNAKMAEQYIPKNKGTCKFTVLADFSRYDISKLDDNSGQSFDAVRACFFKNEREDVLDFCRKIQEKGYFCFVQPVDILGYTDLEIIELIEKINKIEPYCFSIVDTFGSMFTDDLGRIFSLLDHNLASSIKIGFHSHNNMQMSNALSQEFVKISQGKRDVIIDTTIEGMGRGAGNTPTELVVQYLNKKLQYNYDIDALLDTIDNYMGAIHARCKWGYTIPYFIAGSYSAHVNNIAFFKQKNSIRSKDIRYILNKIGSSARKRYDYDLLEKTYFQYLESDIDDTKEIEKLQKYLNGRNVLIIAPGRTITTQYNKVTKYIQEKNAVVIQINFISDSISPDFLYFSNIKRFSYWNNDDRFLSIKKIVTSNISCKYSEAIKVSFNSLIKCGWNHVDNSTLMLLRLLDKLEVKSIGIAGLDGYEYGNKENVNYVTKEMDIVEIFDTPMELNREISEMLDDYVKTRQKHTRIEFVTESRFAHIVSH